MARAATIAAKATAAPAKKTTVKAPTAKATTASATKRTSKVTAKPAPKTTRKTVSKTATASKTSATLAKAVESATSAAPSPKVVSTTASAPVNIVTPENLEMKKKELIDKVVLRSGIKKKDAKPVIEAMLAVLGETLGDGRELNLQPLGKVKINRMKQVGKDRVIICKLRQSARAVSEAGNLLTSPLSGAAE